MVAEAPYDIVIGIDLMKAMLLHLDPRNLMLYLPKNPIEYRGDLSEITHSADYVMASCIQGPVDYSFMPTRGERSSPVVTLGEPVASRAVRYPGRGVSRCHRVW